jgi:hypothetical protein
VRCGLSKSHTARRLSCPTLTPVSTSMVADCWLPESAAKGGQSPMPRGRWASRTNVRTDGSRGSTPKGQASLVDRSSRPHASPNRTPSSVEAAVLTARREHRRRQDWLGPELGIAPRTVSRVLRRHDVANLRLLDTLTGESDPDQQEHHGPP